MNRSLIILIGALALCGAVFAGSYFTARHATMVCCTRTMDDLSWLQTEFHLSGADIAHIRELHEGYLPKCGEMCMKIAAKKSELDDALGNGTNITAEAQVKMNELAALRTQCQAQMLQHFITVSQAMPPEEGKRYLDEMKQLTLGSHEQMEQSMSGDTGHEHHQ
ncbi:MAG TPA: hypothetical protein VH251_08620 [Verrucomicrobiae bacterium]|nr:hypothetical protein [Verrucomicrobiae bacterium]